MTVNEAIQFLKAQGYCVTVPPSAATPRATGWVPPIGAYRPVMKNWRQGRYTVTFKDGVTVTGRALHDGKRWQIGSAVHAAIDRYRYRPAALTDDCDFVARMKSADMIRVPRITSADIDGETFDAAMLSRETAEYRAPSANRFGVRELATPTTKITREQRDFWKAHFAERKAQAGAPRDRLGRPVVATSNASLGRAA